MCVVPKDVRGAGVCNLINFLAVLATLNSLPETPLACSKISSHLLSSCLTARYRISLQGISITPVNGVVNLTALTIPFAVRHGDGG